MELRALSREEVREIDRRAVAEYGLAEVVLMENAGHQTARWLAELGVNGLVLLCCGKGNNGGDAYVSARHLEAWGFQVHVLLACNPSELTGPALINFRILSSCQIPVTHWDDESQGERLTGLFREADWVVDGLLGTGMRGRVREPLRSYVEQINGCHARKLSIDIPSGLDCDLGVAQGCAVRADFTATFVSTKLGFAGPEAAQYLGQVRVFDIGLPARLLREFAK